MANIKMNFLSLTPTDFHFQIYRKPKSDDTQKEDGIYLYWLSKDDGEKRFPYLISFEYQPNFEKHLVSSLDSLGLTKKYLIRKLIETLENSNFPFSFEQIKTFTDERIEFSIGTEVKGNKIIYLTPYYLEDRNSFGFLIDYKFSLADGQSFDKEVQRFSLSLDKNYRSNRNYYSDKYNLLQWFLSKAHFVLNNIQIYNNEILQLSTRLTEVESQLLSKKEYIFKNNYSSNSQFQGIKNFGPYLGIEIDVLFVFIFEERFKSFANDIYLSLIGKANPGTFPGLQQLFQVRFEISNVQQVKLADASQQQLMAAVEQTKAIRNSNPAKKVIGIYLEDHKLGDEASSDSYYLLKYHFIMENLPLQVVNFEKSGGKNALKWSTSNLALAIFSKLGGIPWIVRPSNNHCLILGMGSSHKRDVETGEIIKYFAYTVCLDSSGLYKELSVLANDNNKDSYIENLKNSLIALLNSDRFSQYRTCVLHLPFKIKQDEIHALSAAIKEVNGMDFITIKINLDSKFFGYSEHNTLVPYESSFVKLSRSQYLVWFEGLQYGKEVVDKRLSNPVHIQFLNFNNLQRIDERKFLQDVLNLSGANWRGFNAKSIPISIYYSQLISEYSKAFENINENDKLPLSNEKPWFL